MIESGAVSLGVDLVRFSEKHGLTARERQVLGLLVCGHDSVPRIAEELQLSRNTVHNHFKNIFRRARCNSKTALLAKFISGVAARRARPTVAAPRVLLLRPRDEHQQSMVEDLSRLGMQVYVEPTPGRLLDRVRDLRIHVVVTDAERDTVEDGGPVGLLEEIYGEHPAIFYANPSGLGRDSRVMSMRAYELPRELDALAIAIYRHCNNASYGRARARRVTTSLSARIGKDRIVTITNLSAQGAFVELPNEKGGLLPPAPGEKLDLALALGDGEALPVEAEVVWTRQGAAPGVGVRFMGMGEDDTRRLRKVLNAAPLAA